MMKTFKKINDIAGFISFFKSRFKPYLVVPWWFSHTSKWRTLLALTSHGNIADVATPWTKASGN